MKTFKIFFCRRQLPLTDCDSDAAHHIHQNWTESSNNYTDGFLFIPIKISFTQRTILIDKIKERRVLKKEEN